MERPTNRGGPRCVQIALQVPVRLGDMGNRRDPVERPPDDGGRRGITVVKKVRVGGW